MNDPIAVAEHLSQTAPQPAGTHQHWNPAWPAVWQRHYAALRELVGDKEGQADVLPGVTVHGMDIGKWLQKQRQHAVWTGLMNEQRELLEQLGITPMPPEPTAPAKPSKTAGSAFERGVAPPPGRSTRPAPAP